MESKLLYVDETECPEYFIVTGLLVNSKEDVDLAYKRFKNNIKGIRIPRDKKARLFTEFKSTLLDRDYKRVKEAMISELNKLEYCAVYSCYVKKISFPQSVKEKIYIALLMRIVMEIRVNVEIVFDTFNNSGFESDIINCMQGCPNVVSIKPGDSQKEAGIQFVDNICSILRLHKTKRDIHAFHSLIKGFVKEV